MRAAVLFLTFSLSFPQISNAMLGPPSIHSCAGAIVASRPFTLVDANAFYDIVSKLKDKPLLRKRSLDEYEEIVREGGRLFIMEGGIAGYGIKVDGMLISVFNDSNIRGMGGVAVQNAIGNGARSLICTDDGFLGSFYTTLGFRIVSRFPMGPENAGYNLEWPNGRPDMLYMELGPAP